MAALGARDRACIQRWWPRHIERADNTRKYLFVEHAKLALETSYVTQSTRTGTWGTPALVKHIRQAIDVSAMLLREHGARAPRMKYGPFPI